MGPELVNFSGKVHGGAILRLLDQVVAEETRSRSVRHTMTCFFTMVAVDAQGVPTPVPQRALESDEDRRRWEMARLRRQLRGELQARYEALTDPA